MLLGTAGAFSAPPGDLGGLYRYQGTLGETRARFTSAMAQYRVILEAIPCIQAQSEAPQSHRPRRSPVQVANASGHPGSGASGDDGAEAPLSDLIYVGWPPNDSILCRNTGKSCAGLAQCSLILVEPSQTARGRCEGPAGRQEYFRKKNT